MGENLFDAKLCMHGKITSVRSYKKLQGAETQTHKQILMMHALVKLNLWMIEIPCVIIYVEMIYSIYNSDKKKRNKCMKMIVCVLYIQNWKSGQCC